MRIFIAVFLFGIFFSISASAQELMIVPCSREGGINCAAGPSWYGSPMCSKGGPSLITFFYQRDECKNSPKFNDGDCLPPISTKNACVTKSQTDKQKEVCMQTGQYEDWGCQGLIDYCTASSQEGKNWRESYAHCALPDKKWTAEDCVRWYGEAGYDSTKNACYCKAESLFNVVTGKCDPVGEKCVEYLGDKFVYNTETSKCECKAGLKLNASTYQCEDLSFKKILRLGNSGKDVTRLQNFLIKYKYLKVKATGYFGTATKTALIKFQKAKAVKQTGILDKATMAVINPML